MYLFEAGLWSFLPCLPVYLRVGVVLVYSQLSQSAEGPGTECEDASRNHLPLQDIYVAAGGVPSRLEGLGQGHCHMLFPRWSRRASTSAGSRRWSTNMYFPDDGPFACLCSTETLETPVVVNRMSKQRERISVN